MKYLVLAVAATIVTVLVASCNDKRSPIDGGCSTPIFKDFHGVVLGPQAQDTTLKIIYAPWNISILDTLSKVYVSDFDQEVPAKLECTWLTLERLNGLKISVEENTTGKERYILVSLSAGNCSVDFWVTQKGKVE